MRDCMHKDCPGGSPVQPFRDECDDCYSGKNSYRRVKPEFDFEEFDATFALRSGRCTTYFDNREELEKEIATESGLQDALIVSKDGSRFRAKVTVELVPVGEG